MLRAVASLATRWRMRPVWLRLSTRIVPLIAGYFAYLRFALGTRHGDNLAPLSLPSFAAFGL